MATKTCPNCGGQKFRANPELTTDHQDASDCDGCGQHYITAKAAPKKKGGR